MKQLLMALAICAAATTGVHAQTTNTAVNASQQIDDNTKAPAAGKRHTAQPRNANTKPMRTTGQPAGTTMLMDTPPGSATPRKPTTPRTTGSNATPTPTPDNPVR